MARGARFFNYIYKKMFYFTNTSKSADITIKTQIAFVVDPVISY